MIMAPPIPISRRPVSAAGHSQRILLVEDEYPIAEMLGIFLQTYGYTLLHTADGEEALALCQKYMPHLILMDVVLPGMDGYEVSRRLRQQPGTAHIPIIFLTRRDRRAERLRALEIGIEDFVAKPFDLEELLLRVQNVMAYAERQHLTEMQSGFPGAAVARQRIAQARSDPDLAVIEVALQHSTPYCQCYGQAQLHEVQAYLGQVILWALEQSAIASGFVGSLDADQFVVVCPASKAQALGERMVNVFNFNIRRHYNSQDQERGSLLFDGADFPLMCIRCRVYHGENVREVI